MSRAWRLLVGIGTGLSLAGAAHAAVNLRRLRRPQPAQATITEPVSILIPARDEAGRIGATVATALGQRRLPHMTVTVLDDDSADATADRARAAGAGDPRLEVRTERIAVPQGWLGKPYACHRLAASAAGSVLVFLDADVLLDRDAVAGAVQMLRATGTDFASVWPQQLATGLLQRLVQPVQQWSWATTLPLRLAEQPGRPSLAAANGQFLVVTRSGYDRIGGHAAVADCVLEDIELARAAKRAGLRAGLWDGSTSARCRMYADASELVSGYRKSLWAAFGPQGAPLPVRGAAALAAWSALGVAYLVPPAAMIVGPGGADRAVGAVGYAAAVVNRALVAARTGSPVWPDSLGHPLSIAAFIGLSADSLLAHGAGRTEWKGRPVRAGAARR